MILRLVSSVVLFACITSVYADEDMDKAKAKAALALAKSQRERKATTIKQMENNAKIHEGEIYDDVDIGRKVAKVLGKPLVILVGVEANGKEFSTIHGCIKDEVVFVKVKYYNNNPEARVILTSPDGEYKVAKEELQHTNPLSVRKRLGLEITQQLLQTYMDVRTPIQIYATRSIPQTAGTVCST